MSQTSITTKHTITATTGTTGVSLVASGRTNPAVLTWRQPFEVGYPSADGVLSISGSFVNKGREINGWKSKLGYVVPVMKTLSDGNSAGYVATPGVEAELSLILNIYRPSVMADATAAQSLDMFAYALLTDAKLRANVLGYTPADT